MNLSSQIDLFSIVNLILKRSIVPFLILMSAQLCLSQGFPCDGTFYFASTDNEESRFYNLEMNEDNQTFVYKEIPLISEKKRHITCLGYNVKDRNIYGLDFNTYELLRITSDGTMSSLGVPENLDTTFQYRAGDMTADGRRLVVVAFNPQSGIDERVYSIQVNDPPRYYAGFFPVVSDVPVAMSDITVDPVVGVTYGFDYLGGQLVSMNRSGLTTANHSPFPIEKVSEGMGALFFSRSGQLYGLGSPGRPGGQQNILYRINKSRGGTEKIEKIFGGEDTDGCGCPFTIKLSKKSTPDVVVGCQEVTIEYIIDNRAGIGQVYTQLEDFLPDVLQIKLLEMENLFTVNVRSGIGGNHLLIDEWTLVLGENKLKITAELGAAQPGQYGSQATLTNLPLAFNERVVSDNPVTSEINDPTLFVINDIDHIQLEDYVWSSCDLDTMFLTLPLTGNFMWSDGSIQETLPVTTNGLYSVTFQNDCYTIEDSIQVNLETESLSLDLGPDRKVKLGKLIELGFTSNAKEIKSISWSGSENISFQCDHCPVNTFIANGNGTAMLTVVDGRGCTISDDIQVLVDQTKKIFVPNAFSPNQDGINDYLNLYGTSGIVLSFKIFDRWGNLILHRENIQMELETEGWDGIANGQQMPIGVYIWTAKILFPDQVTQQFAGSTTLLR